MRCGGLRVAGGRRASRGGGRRSQLRFGEGVTEMAIEEMIVKVVEGRSLCEAEAAAAMLDIVEGLATPAQIAAFVTALRMKGETAEEIAGLARIMRRYATRVETSPDAIDIVGTGGDGGNTFNISTVSALVVAAAGG